MVLIAKDIAEPEFLSLVGETTVLDAARQMKERHLGFIVVVSSQGAPEGMVTEWDFLSKIISEGKDPSSVKLAEIMSPNLVTVKSNEGIDSVAKLMAERGIRRVLVIQDGKIIGAVTSRTILRRLEEYVNRISAQIARLQSPTF
jgi:CBS domain-containing protein